MISAVSADFASFSLTKTSVKIAIAAPSNENIAPKLEISQAVTEILKESLAIVAQEIAFALQYPTRF
jgi:hypothetical protein